MIENWLPLVDYSNKYRISISTLRRRIKLDSIPFKLDSGKYYIIDESPDELEGQVNHKQSIQSVHSVLTKKKAPPKVFGSSKKNFSDESPGRDDHLVTTKGVPQERNPEPVFSAANRLLDELKKAYTQILQEKDEQIRNLREEISDLKTLVRVLEGENERITGRTIE